MIRFLYLPLGFLLYVPVSEISLFSIAHSRQVAGHVEHWMGAGGGAGWGGACGVCMHV